MIPNDMLQGLDVLVIDDTAANLSLLTALLRDAGFNVRATVNPLLGLQSALLKPPDLILLDIQMPEMSGFEVCSRIKQNEATQDIPVIFVSAQNEIEDRIKGFELGGVDFIGRPFQRQEILARVSTHLALRKTRLELERQISERTKELEEQRRLTKELHDVQTQLIQSEKMASIGQLAAGVAHEINNPIGYVYSNLGTLEQYIADLLTVMEVYQAAEAELPPENAARHRIEAVKTRFDLNFLKEDIPNLMAESKEGIVRVRKIVQDLKDFSHVDETQWQIADLHQCLDSTLNMVMNEIKYKAELVKDYGDIPQVECLPNQLNQVFMNLLVNAVQAIAQRGVITIRTGNIDDKVFVEISDTGGGIADEHLQRIFEPFFTTKPVGKGTGLGLSLSYAIVQKHHGQIEVSSEVGRGTQFRILLPCRQTESNDPA